MSGLQLRLTFDGTCACFSVYSLSYLFVLFTWKGYLKTICMICIVLQFALYFVSLCCVVCAVKVVLSCVVLCCVLFVYIIDIAERMLYGNAIKTTSANTSHRVQENYSRHISFFLMYHI